MLFNFSVSQTNKTSANSHVRRKAVFKDDDDEDDDNDDEGQNDEDEDGSEDEDNIQTTTHNNEESISEVFSSYVIISIIHNFILFLAVILPVIPVKYDLDSVAKELNTF